MTAYFVTGTDTDVGKTVISAALLNHFNQQGLSTIGFKPIAAGCEQTDLGLRNADALILQQLSSVAVAYQQVNPFAFEPPIAPHIAARLVKQRLTIEDLNQAYSHITDHHTDIIIVEGAGGWCLPINEQQFMYQWVAEQQLPVIMVVGVKLGCLNHALLTQAFIEQQGLKIVGWVANIISGEMRFIEKNIATLEQHLHSPLLATVPYIPDPDLANIDVYFDFSQSFY